MIAKRRRVLSLQVAVLFGLQALSTVWKRTSVRAINMDGIVDAKDLYIVGRNYGKTFSIASLGGIVAVAGVHTYKKRKQRNS